MNDIFTVIVKYRRHVHIGLHIFLYIYDIGFTLVLYKNKNLIHRPH